MRSALLIHEPPLQVLPSLAVAIGLHEAIVLQQIHYWLGRVDTLVDGHRWVYNSVSQWREQFPFWSDDTIGRTLKSLRASGIVVAEKLSKDAFNKTLYYRIDYSKLPAPITATCGNRDMQLADISVQRLPAETTQREDAPRKRSRQASPADHIGVEDLMQDGLSEEVAQAWIAHRKRKKANLTKLAWKGIKAEAAKAGWPLQAAIEKALARGWQSFDAAFVERERPAGASAFAGVI